MGKPRGKMYSYAFFVQACREEHKKKNPGGNVGFKDFSRECAGRWKAMSESEKKVFQDLAAKDKIRYDKEMQHYVPDPNLAKRGKGGKRQRKDPNAPKRALSAFFWFCNDERPKVRAANPEFTVGDVAKELGRRWKLVTQSTKMKYETMSERDKARYAHEKEIYKKTGRLYSNQAGEEEEDEEEEDEESE